MRLPRPHELDKVELSDEPNVGYTYLFPTICNFGSSQYEFTILPDTNVIFDVEPVATGIPVQAKKEKTLGSTERCRIDNGREFVREGSG